MNAPIVQETVQEVMSVLDEANQDLPVCEAGLTSAIGRFAEILPGLRTSSEVIILDFAQIPSDIPDYKNVRAYFEDCALKRINPRLPVNRQRFNDMFIDSSGKKYLIGRYAEDRIEMLYGSSIMREGRTFHLGIDIFCKKLMTVVCPLDGVVVRTGNEPGPSGYGYYAIIEHMIRNKIIYTFYGHLSRNLPLLGPIAKGDSVGLLGDFGENGGWSRHVHFQLLTDLSPEGTTPIGYSTKADLELNKSRFPDPNVILGIPCL